MVRGILAVIVFWSALALFYYLCYLFPLIAIILAGIGGGLFVICILSYAVYTYYSYKD